MAVPTILHDETKEDNSFELSSFLFFLQSLIDTINNSIDLIVLINNKYDLLLQKEEILTFKNFIYYGNNKLN